MIILNLSNNNEELHRFLLSQEVCIEYRVLKVIVNFILQWPIPSILTACGQNIFNYSTLFKYNLIYYINAEVRVKFLFTIVY